MQIDAKFWLLLSAGFSLGASTLLLIAFATVYRSFALARWARLAGNVMLIGLAITQLLHTQIWPTLAPPSRGYAVILATQSLGFYLLFLGVLRPKTQPFGLLEAALSAATIVSASLLPAAWACAAVMACGTLFATHLATLVHRLRSQRRWFVLEHRMLLAFAAMAAAIATLGAFSWALGAYGWQHFALIYSALISLSFALVIYLLLRFPDLTDKAEVAVQQSYVVSSLQKVDRAAAKVKLEHLFTTEKIYQDESLSLSKLALLMDLSTHQTSELINTEFDCSFSQMLRRYRVEAAKAMLINEPRASVLSVGLSVGFGSQSNFYLAFRELTTQNPGQYRNSLLATSRSS